MNTDRIIGSFLGLSLGDALGAPYEGGLPERAVWAVIGKNNGKRRWTDDTQMAIDVAESLLACGGLDQDDMARRFANSYAWSRGYGRGAATILKRIGRGMPWQEASRSVFPEGSFGNGAAMRAPVIGLYFAAEGAEAVVQAARASAEITHAHALGREGAVHTALATALMLRDTATDALLDRLVTVADSPVFSHKLEIAQAWLQTNTQVGKSVVARELGRGIAAADSCVTAIYLALRHRADSYENLIEAIIGLGGDTDTIAAMAGGIWGASRGIKALPEGQLAALEDHARLLTLGKSLAAAILK